MQSVTAAPSSGSGVVGISRFGYYDQRGDPLCGIDLGGLWFGGGPVSGYQPGGPCTACSGMARTAAAGLAVTSR